MRAAASVRELSCWRAGGARLANWPGSTRARRASPPRSPSTSASDAAATNARVPTRRRRRGIVLTIRPYPQQLCAGSGELQRTRRSGAAGRPSLHRPVAIADHRTGSPAAPPQNLEAEQSVLGAVLLSDTALPALIIDERLQPEDFYREAH